MGIEIHIETEGLQNINKLAKSINEKTQEASLNAKKITISPWKCPEKLRMIESTIDLSNSLKNLSQASLEFALEASSALNRFEDCVKRTNRRYDYTIGGQQTWKTVNDALGETKISPVGPKTWDIIDKLKNIWIAKTDSSKFQGTTQEMYLALIATPLSILVGAAIGTSIGVISDSGKNNAKNEQQNINQNTSNINLYSGAPKYDLPEYATKDVAPYPNGIYGPVVYWRDGRYGRVAEWNDEGMTQLSCTYYTLRKLNERGISFPCTGGPGNGGSWMYYFDTEAGLPYSMAGYNSLEELFSKNGLPQDNIVVSCSSIYAPDSGHVLLIDHAKVEGNDIKVTFSDNYPNISSLNGRNEPETLTLEQFCQRYGVDRGTILGAAILGAGDGDY